MVAPAGLGVIADTLNVGEPYFSAPTALTNERGHRLADELGQALALSLCDGFEVLVLRVVELNLSTVHDVLHYTSVEGGTRGRTALPEQPRVKEGIKHPRPRCLPTI